ncbi:MAG: transglutaminase domain-containing protein [candidate division WOR-3 bacterium]|nr:MAG: transglutaminase domain-containing protein [candidate division WOR-3 bacterium]
MRKLLGIIIIIIIFGLSAYLLLKIPRPTRASHVSIQNTTVLESQERWLGIFLQGQRIGYTFTKISHTVDGVFTESRSQMTLGMMQMARSIETHVYARTDNDYLLEEFSLTIATQGHETRVDGTIDGTTLTLTSFSQGVSESQTIELQEKPYIPEAVEEIIQQRNMQPGDETTIPYFDPTTQSSTTAHIKMMNTEDVPVMERIETGRRVEVIAQGITSVMWFDDDFQMIKVWIPALGMESVPMSREEALVEIVPTQAFDLLSFFAVRLDTKLPKPPTLTYLKLRLENITDTDLDIEDSYQRITSTQPLEIEFTRPVLDTLPQLSLPMTEHDEFTEPSVYIQCQEPDIVAAARKMAGNETDPRKIVARLVTGVSQLVRDNPTASLPSAIDVLKTKEGDCTEHTILFTALARALGIPTKIYVGLGNIDGKAYFYHAWCAVWLGEWVPVDPTWNQYPADVGHLKLKEGGLEEWAAVMRVVGQLVITVVDYRTGNGEKP